MSAVLALVVALAIPGPAHAARSRAARVSVGAPAGSSAVDSSGARAARGRGLHLTVSADDSNAGSRRVVIVGSHLAVDGDGELVRIFSDVTVAEGETVDGDVVTIFGSSRIDGHVAGNAVAVFGSVDMGPKAAIDGDLVAIFGRVHRDEGNTVGGETVDLGFAPLFPGLPALPTILLLVGLFWILSLIGGALVSLVMPDRLMRITATASRRMGGSLLLGLVALPVLITAMVLLCITVIGIPVALLLPVAFVFVSWIGQYAGLYGLGLKLMHRRIGQGSVFAGLAVGTLFIAAFFAVGALLAGPAGMSRTIALFLVSVGGLICAALQLIGVGAVFLSRFGTRPVELVREPGASIPAAALPAAPAAPAAGA